MRDARILAWLLADPARVAQLRPDQLEAVHLIGAAEGLADALEARLAGTARVDLPGECAAMLCSAAQNLLGQGDLEAGLAQLWHIHLVICQGPQQPDFWANVRDHARTLRITRHVSRALRLSHHLFETPVDPYLAWQGQRTDIFFMGRLLARNGRGVETAKLLRLAFRLRARWLARRA